VPHEVEFDDGDTAIEYEWLDLFGAKWHSNETPAVTDPVEGTATKAAEGVTVVLLDGTRIQFSALACA
jgi:hypothetical protein